MNIHRWSITQKSLDDREVKVFPPPLRRGPAKNHLRNMLLPHKLGDPRGDIATFQAHNGSPKVLCKALVLVQRALIFVALVGRNIHVNHIELSIHSMRHAPTPRDYVLGNRIRTDANCNALPNTHAGIEDLPRAMRLQSPIHNLRNLPQRKFAQSNEIPPAEEISDSTLGAVNRINVAASHPRL